LSLAEIAPPLVFLLRSPLSTRDRQRFGIDTLTARGHPLTIADLSPWLHPGVTLIAPDGRDRVTPIRSGREFLALLWRHRHCQFIDLCGLKAADLRRFAPFVRLFGIQYATVQLGLAPPAPLTPDPELRGWAIWWLRIRNLLTLRSSVYARLIRPSMIFIGGEAGYAEVTTNSRLVPAHSMDFDLYRARKPELTIDDELIVFIDQDVPNHVEYKMMGTPLKVDAETYYSQLRRCLSISEVALGRRAVIAAHPRSSYAPRDPCFGGREVITGRTIDLIARAALVITHGSTAVSFAVLLDKPLLFLTNAMMSAASYAAFMDVCAAALGARLMNMERLDENEVTGALAFDRECYAKFIELYIRCPDAADASLWEIVSDATSTAIGSRGRRFGTSVQPRLPSFLRR